MKVYQQFDFKKPIDVSAYNGSMALRIAHLIKDAGGRALFVGGSIRDAVMGKSNDDIDIEVYGIEEDRLESILKSITPISCVGKSFGVFLVRDHKIDVALPRTESKSGIGHKGFSVHGDHTLDIPNAAKRRDFTINAMLWDPISNELFDPFNGLNDLNIGVLRHCSPQFIEDPLRVLRAMQFVSRFEMQPAAETILLCRTIPIENLPKERLFEEWKKLILLGNRPSLGLQFLNDSRWIDYFPDLRALIGCIQDKQWHPEGDVFTHTCLALDAFARDRINNEREDLIVGFAVLCHDLGKPLCTFTDEAGRVRSPAHEYLGETPTRLFLRQITEEKALTEDIVSLVMNHMKPLQFFKSNAGDAAIRRLAAHVGRIDRLVRVEAADHQGRLNADQEKPVHGKWLLDKARELAIAQSKPQPILLGRHLIEYLHLQPSPLFRMITDRCYQEQLDGHIKTLDDALKLAKRFIEENNHQQA